MSYDPQVPIVLSAAARIIRERGFCRNRFTVASGAVCARGAIAVASGHEPNQFWDLVEVRGSTVAIADNVATSIARSKLTAADKEFDIADYNNNVAKDGEAIASVLEEASAAYTACSASRSG